MRLTAFVSRLSIALLFLVALAAEAERQVVITIDDLPRGGDRGDRTLDGVLAMTRQLLAPFAAGDIPVIGFVNEGRRRELGDDGLHKVLDVWLDSGADLGNHSYAHLNINEVTLDEYTADITRGEPLTRAVLESRGRSLEYYRHPFLFTGPTRDKKRGLAAFLDSEGYRPAPVTIDNADYLYAALYTQPEYRERVEAEYIPYMESVVAFFERRSVEVFDREIPQILLLHANQLNADMMPALLAMFRGRGYRFVSLEIALADEAYTHADDYTGRAGISWLHRWARTDGLPDAEEPRPAQWAWDALAELQAR